MFRRDSNRPARFWKTRKWRLTLFQMYFNVAQSTAIKHQAADSLLRVSRTGKDCILMDSATTQYRSFWSSPHKNLRRKEYSKPNHITNYCYDNGTNATSTGFPAVCPIMTPRAYSIITRLVELLTEQDQETFSGEVAGTFRTTKLVLLAESSQHPSLSLLTRRHPTIHNTKLSPANPSVLIALARPAETYQRVLLVGNHWTGAVLATNNQ